MDENLLVIADGAAFGSEMEKLTKLIESCPNIKLYLPESFEWLILKSGLVDGNNIMQMLEHPEEYIDSEKYFSWERYFTTILIQLTQNSYLRYAKHQLNAVYLQEKMADKILAVMKEISLK